MALSKFLNLYNKNKVLKKTLGLSVISLVIHSIGFFVPIILSNFFGVTKETDNFFLAYGIVVFGGGILTGSVQTVIVPFAVELYGKKNALSKFLISTYFFFTLGALIIVAIGYIIIFTFYNQLDTKLINYLLISLPIVIFLVINGICSGFLNSCGFYNIVAIAPISNYSIIYVSIFLLHAKMGILSVLIGFLGGQIAKSIFLIFFCNNLIDFEFNVGFIEFAALRDFFRKSLNQILGSSIIGASPLIDSLVASNFAVGSISILDYGNRIFSGINLALSSFLVVLLTKWAKDYSTSRFSLASVKRYLKYFVFAASVITIPLLVFSKDIIGMVYPKLEHEHTYLIVSIFRINSLAFIFTSIMQVLNRAAIANKFTSLILRVAVVKSIMNFVFDLIFGFFFQVVGIAIASLLNHVIGFLIMYSLLRSEISKKTEPETSREIPILNI